MKNYSLLKLEKNLGEPAENLPSGHSQFHSKMAFLPFLNAFGAAAVLLALALTFASCTKNSIQQKNQEQSEKNAGFSVDFDLTKMNANMLKGRIREKAMTQADLAPQVGLSLSRFNAKLNETGGAEFSLGEVRAIKRVLGLDQEQTEQIFFS